MPRPTIDLLISDIDGTLLTSNHELTPATKRVALELRMSGIHLCLVSSRPPRFIKPIARELGLRAPFAAFNGALIQLPDDQILAHSVVPSTIAQRIRAIATQIGLDVWLYDQQDWFVAMRTPFVDREAQTAGFLPRTEGYPAQLKRENIKLTVVGTPDVVLRAEERMRGELGSVVSASRSKPRFLDITAFGWNKSMVLKRLATLLNLTPEQIAVIGDGPGDAALFKQSILSIAMGQAVDSVKNQATHVTTSNDDEGWARGVEQFILKKRSK
jgi:Cof subfamily protein (haloacid dehalogenase superfamily)